MLSLKSPTKPRIIVENLTVVRGGHPVISDVSFEVGPNTMLGVLGPSGGGKTTLFQTMAGLIPHSEGSVTVCGAHAQRGGVAYVSQTDTMNWNFPATVHDVVSMGRYANLGWLKRFASRDKDLIRNCLNRVGLWERRNSLVTDLSGGQRQRVCIARALAQESGIIMLDEALSNVDVGAQEGILELLRSCCTIDGKIVLLATHDLTNLEERFDKLLCLNHHICGYGAPAETFTPEIVEELYGAHRDEFDASDYSIVPSAAQ